MTEIGHARGSLTHLTFHPLTFYRLRTENTPAARREQGQATYSTTALSSTMSLCDEGTRQGQTMVCATLFDFTGVIANDKGALPGIHSHPQSDALPRHCRVRESRQGAILMSHCHRKSAGTRRPCAAWDGDREDFAVAVSADDITPGKFDPALYQTTLNRPTAIDYTVGLG